MAKNRSSRTRGNNLGILELFSGKNKDKDKNKNKNKNLNKNKTTNSSKNTNKNKTTTKKTTTSKTTNSRRSSNRSSRTMGNNKGLFENSRLFDKDKKSTTSKNRGSAKTTSNKNNKDSKMATSVVARRAGLTQQDYNQVKKKTENRKKVVTSTMQQIVGSHAKTLGLLGGYDKQTSGRSMGKYGNPEDKVVNSEKRANKISDWGTKQIEKGKKKYNKATKDMGKVGKFGADVANAAIGLASDAVAGPLAPVSMFSRSFGSAANTAQREGATDEQAAMYGLASGALELATERIGNVAKPLQKMYGKGVADDFAERVAKKMADAAKSKTGKDFAYHGGKTAAAFASEALEEMVAEGLDPVIANTIYANETGTQHSTSLKEIARAGLVGGVLGGVLGAGGQVVEYGQGAQVRDIYGEDGVKQLAKTAKESDDDKDAFTAEALDQMINEGGGIAAGQALQLKRAVEKQNEKDRTKLQDLNRATDEVMRKEGLVNFLKKIDENGNLDLTDSAREVYEGAKQKATEIADVIVPKDGQNQLKDMTVDEITSEVASIVTGAVMDIDTVNTFTTGNTLARQIYEQTTGETLPATNRETREYLYNQIAKNRQTSLEAETALQMDRFKGNVIQRMTTTYGAKGQSQFETVIGNVDVRNQKMLDDALVTFENYYEAGRQGITLQEMAAPKMYNPAYDVLPPEAKTAAWKAGEADGIEARNLVAGRAKDIQLALGQKISESQPQANSVAPRGRVIFEFKDMENSERFTASQYTMYKKLAEVFNINIHITDDADSNGFYVDGEVWMSVDADRDMKYVFGHEITHHLEKFAPEEYSDYKELIRTAWGVENLNAAVDAKIAHYAAHNVQLSREAAFDEIVADATYEMIQDHAFVTELCNEDRTLARRILDCLRNMINKIRAMLAENDFTPAQNANLLSQLDILKEAEKLWEAGLKKAAENRDAVGMVDTSEDTQYQFAGYAEDGRGIYVSDYKKGVSKDEKTKDILDLIVNLWSKKPIELVVKEPGKEDRVIEAKFDPYYEEGVNSDAGKIAGGNTAGTRVERRVNLNIGKDYYQILSEAEYTGTNAEDMQHDTSDTHKEGQIWHYFLNQIYYKENADGELEPYTVFVNVRENKDGSFVYGFETYQDGNVEKAAKRKRITLTSALAETDDSANSSNSSTDIISETSENSNKKFSLNDSEGRQLSPQQQEYFKDSKVRDENGDLLVVYHGTPAGEFYTFDKSKGSVEGDFGSGFYFSNNESDMESNYEGGGPDFENKVQRQADLMEAIEDIDHDEAERIVREQLFVAPNRFDVYLNIENPAIVGETILLTPEDFDPGYDPDDFDSEDEYYEQVDQDMQDALEELMLDIERNVDIDLGAEEIGSVLFEAWSEGGIGIEELKDKLTEIYMTDSEGDFVSNEVARQIIESLGYDGIIDPTVSRKWRNMGLTPDTKHFIAFRPEQIKYVTNENPTTNPDIRYSFKDSEGNSLSPQQAEYFADSKIRDENGNLKVMYHGSPETFTVFDPIQNGGKNGIGEGFGIYLTDSEEIATPYSNNGNLMKGYVNITNPATSFNKTIGKSDLIKLIKATCEKEAQEYVDDGEYDTIEEALRDTWISNYVDTYKGKIDKSYQKAADAILDYNENDRDIVQEVMVGSGANTYAAAYKFYDVLKETLGIDGFLVRWGDESNYAEVALAFNSNQFKNIDNENPTEDPDVRYSFKDEENIIDEEKALTYNSINDLENDLKERWTAYEKDKESRRIAAEAIRDLSESKYSLSDSRRTVAGVREVVADGLSREFISKGFVDFRGRQVNTAKDLAELMQVHRDPRFETFRIVYMKGNKIVGTEAISAQMPGFAPVFTQEEGGFYNRFKYMKERMSRLKADGYYLLHNHPSGIPEPSGPDIRVSEVYATEVPGYKGHVILDHDTYGSVEFNNNDTAGMVHQLENQMSIDFLKTATVNHPILGTPIEGSSDVANVCKAVENNDYVSSLIFIDSKGKVTGVENVSNAIMNNDAELAGYLRNAARYYGARAVAMGTHDPLIAAKSEVHIEKQSLLDCIWFYGNGDISGWESMRAQMPGYVIPNMAFGKDEDEYGGKRVNEDNFNDNYNYHDNINISVDDVNEYVNAHPEEFPDPLPYWETEQAAHNTRQKTMKELQEQLDRMKTDKKLTHGKVLDPKSIEEDVNGLIRMLMSYSEGTTKRTDHGLVKLIQANAKNIFADLRAGNKEDAILTAYYTAEEIVQNLKLVNDEMFNEYKELREYLRTTRVHLSEEDRSNIPDFNDFRKKQMGRMRIVNEGGMSVDNMYQELLEMYPGMFDPELTHPADQLIEIADVRETLDPYDIMLSHEETEQLIKETANDILELVVNGKPWKSWADRNKEVYDEKVRALKQKHQEAVRGVRQKEKERAEKKIETIKQKNKERQQKQRDARASREYIRKMEDQISWLSERLLKPTDDKHLPEGYQKAIAQLLCAIDTQSERSKKLEEKYGVSKKRLKFLALKEQYEKIADQPDSDIMIDEDVANDLSQLAEILEDQEISEATPAQLEQIYKVLRNITHGIRMVNKAFVEDQAATISELAETTIEHAAAKKRHIDRSGMIGGLDSILNESMVTPRDFFERLGGGIEQAYVGIRKGFDKHVDNITTARTFFEGLFRKYYNKKKPGSEIEKWRDTSTNQTFELDAGGSITLNAAQRMSLYCLMKREQAQGHIMGSGIVATEVDVNSKIKKMFGAKMDVKAATARITWYDIDNILETLTPEQIQIADELQNFLNNECAAWGNEVSMRMYGYEKFTEENYFPIKSADVYLDSKFDGRSSVERIRNFGFTKGTVVNANNPIVIDDIFTVVADHINHMSMYSGFAAPIADFTRVYNYKERAEDGTIVASTKSALQDAYGKKVGSYITKFMSDLQSNTQTRTEGVTRLVNKTLANYKKATIAGNLRVALQQPTAIARAWMLISPKYFTKLNAKANMQRMKEHCQVARWKAWGHNQVDMARDIDDIMMNNEWTKLDLVTMQIYGALDTVTWSYIWGAVEKETRKLHPEVAVDSDEYFRICNDRASEIFDKTQVVDSVLHRSEVMRNQDTMSKMVTSFMAEPTRTFNMVRGQYAKALDQWHDGDKGKATATAAKTTYIFLLNAMLCAMAAAVADALRGKDLDDDDEPEEWIDHVLNNFVGNANPMMMIPVLSETISYWQGWGSQNMAFEGIEELIKSFKAIVDKATGKKDDKTWGELIRKGAESAGLVFGVPVKNILRELETFGKLIGYEASAATEKTDEDSVPLLEKLDKLDLLSVEDGSFIDNILNHFGWNLTEAEKADRERQELIKGYEAKLEGLTGKDREEKLWSLVTRGYTTDLKNGDLAAIEERRKILEEMGGDVALYDERVEGHAVNAYKKTIGTDDKTSAILKEFLKTKYGYTDGKISTEIIAKSDLAKELQLQLCANDEDAAVDTLAILIDEGITEADFYVLFEERYQAISVGDVTTGEFTAPVDGRITSDFGPRTAPTAGASSYHEGMDIAAPAGTVVGAADGGKVSSCGYNKTEGYYVRIYHGNERYTEYKHLEGFCVSKGQAVASGQEIGRVGSTGVSTGPHLHFAVKDNGVYRDPALYLK